jgi:hypothetical protein
LKLEIRYPDRPPHEVELKGALAVVGRDPSCDLVLSDERCSRRHAVLEATPDGLQVRDSGSANGVFVNGKKKERSPLTPGDLIRIGDVILKILPDEPAGTVVMAGDDLVEVGQAPAAARRTAEPTVLDLGPSRPRESGVRAPAPRRAGAPAAAAPGAIRGRPAPGRPLTLTILGALWAVSVFVYGAAVLATPLLELRGTAATVNLAVSSLLALVSALMAFGILTRKPWARILQAVIAGIGLVVCPFTLASATTLIYVLRPSTRAAFGPSSNPAADPAEMTFALTLIVTVVLGAGLCAAGFLAYRFLR